MADKNSAILGVSPLEEDHRIRLVDKGKGLNKRSCGRLFSLKKLAFLVRPPPGRNHDLVLDGDVFVYLISTQTASYSVAILLPLALKP